MVENNLLTFENIANKKILATQRDTDRRQWWLSSSGISVTLLLVMGMASFALPAFLSGNSRSDALFLDNAIRGLWGMVLIFNLYVIYEQAQIHRIRHDFARQLYVLTVLDPLTNLFNRRYIEHRLESEIARHQRNGIPLTIILFDLDAFKQVNDKYGHVVGDNVLRTFAERLQKATRGSDVAARYGGDEFLLLLPECEPEAVQYVLKRLGEIQVAIGKLQLPVRYSVGWTDYQTGESVMEFLERADGALYLDKHRANG